MRCCDILNVTAGDRTGPALSPKSILFLTNDPYPFPDFKPTTKPGPSPRIRFVIQTQTLKCQTLSPELRNGIGAARAGPGSIGPRLRARFVIRAQVLDNSSLSIKLRNGFRTWDTPQPHRQHRFPRPKSSPNPHRQRRRNPRQIPQRQRVRTNRSSHSPTPTSCPQCAIPGLSVSKTRCLNGFFEKWSTRSKAIARTRDQEPAPIP